MDVKSAIVKRYSTPLASILRQSIQEDAAEELTLEAQYDSRGLILREWKLPHGETSAEHHTYTYNEQGQLLEHHLEIPDDGIEERFVTKRNEKGKATEITKFYADDPGERTTYIYDSNDDVAEITAYDADGEFELKETFEFDSKKRMIKRVTEKADGTVSQLDYEYNDQDQIVSIIEKDEKGNLISKQEHDYTTGGLEAKIRQYNAEGKILTEVTSEYDDLARLIMKRTAGFYIRISRFGYDEQGNLIEESLSDENDFVISRSRFEYDENKRLISETIYETDLSRAGRDTHYTNRYEYIF